MTGLVTESCVRELSIYLDTTMNTPPQCDRPVIILSVTEKPYDPPLFEYQLKDYPHQETQ